MHALLDFSHERLTPDEWAVAFRRLAQDDSVGGLASDVTCVVRQDTLRPTQIGLSRWRWANAPATEAVAESIARAGRAGAHLLVLLAPIPACAEATVSLLAAFEADPLFGAAHPRFATDAGADILPVLADRQNRHRLPRATLGSLPPRYLLPDYLSRCFVLRRELVANLEPVTIGDMGGVDLLQEYLRRARRVGYRSVVLNSVVVTVPAHVSADVAECGNSTAGVHWDSDVARTRFRRLDSFEREHRLAALHARPRRLLFDARNLGATVNGTTKAVLGLADALYAEDRSWDVTLVVSKESAEAHTMAQRFTRWAITDALPSEPFAAAFRPSQPWDLSEALQLHRLAVVNLYLMLDTIAWDVVYTAPRRLDSTWRFVARYADGLLFISDFSRQRFLARFPTHPEVRTGVCHLSLDPADYVDPVAASAPRLGTYWFIVGNAYDHKDVRPTLALLARAFPTTRLTALGSSSTGEQIAGVASGQAEETEIQRLYAGAELMIFPSFYEGFGLPIVNALAYGKTVVARDSALLREIADAYVGPGRVVPYSTPDELVERLSCLRHQLPVPSVPIGHDGTGLSGWRATARIVYLHLDDLVSPRSTRREPERHEATSLLEAWADTAPR